jgi:histone-lysine N-methyltransferase SETMAR
VEAEPYLSTEELATKLNSTSSIVHWHLKALEKLSKLRKWVPHEFNSNDLSQCVNICSSFTGCQELGGFAASTLFSKSGSFPEVCKII